MRKDNYWCRVFKVEYKDCIHTVIAKIDSDEGAGAVKLVIESFASEYFLDNNGIMFNDRDALYTFLKNMTPEYAKDVFVSMYIDTIGA